MCGGGCDGPSVPDLNEVIAPLRELSDQVRRRTEDQEVRLQGDYDKLSGYGEADRETLSGEARDRYGFGREERKRFEKLGRPLEEQAIEFARDYDSDERKLREGGRAMADTAVGLQRTRAAAEQRLRSSGFDPSSIRNLATQLGTGTNDALAMVTSAERTRRGIDETGQAMRMQAIGGITNPMAARSRAEGALALSEVGQSRAGTSDAARFGLSGFGSMGQNSQLESGIRGQLADIEMARYGAKQARSQSKMGAIGDVVGFAGQAAGFGLGAGGLGLGSMIPGAVLPKPSQRAA